MLFDQQKAVATIARDFFQPLVRLPIHTWCILGGIDRETSFQASAVGDHGEAHGFGQWHGPRASDILKGCGIDVATAGTLDQCKALHFEMTAGAYKRIWPALMATDTLWAACTVYVRDFERSGAQARDIKRQVALGQKWEAVFES